MAHCADLAPDAMYDAIREHGVWILGLRRFFKDKQKTRKDSRYIFSSRLLFALYPTTPQVSHIALAVLHEKEKKPF
jgi:hypothetical protein